MTARPSLLRTALLYAVSWSNYSEIGSSGIADVQLFLTYKIAIPHGLLKT